MKILIFIEQPDDYAEAQNLIQKAEFKGAESTLVNLNSSLQFAPFKSSGVTFKQEDDFLHLLPLQELNYKALKDAREWFGHRAITEHLKIQGVDSGLVFEHSFVRSVTTVYKFIELIRKIIEIENPNRIIVFSPKKNYCHKDVRFTEEDKLGASITRLLKESGNLKPGIELKEIRPASSGENISGQKSPRKQYRNLRGPVAIIRGILNAIRPSPKKGDVVLVCGHPGKTFPMMEELAAVQKNQLVYFQKHSAPRLLLWLFKRKIPYMTLEDFPLERKSANVEQMRQGFWFPKENRFIEIVKENGLFQYEGLNLLPVFKEKLAVFFTQLLPEIAANILRLQALFKKINCRLILIDEDISYFSRTLLLTGKTFGVKSAEFQHGAVTKYFLHCEVADKKLVWGEYFKKRIIQETVIPSEKVAVIGPVHLDNLVKRYDSQSQLKDRLKIRGKLQIHPESRVILYTPHAFHKSSKGGALNHHNTRRDAEHTLSEVLESAEQNSRIHLIIKLHHADDRPLFYQEFIKIRQSQVRFSIVRFLPIIELMNACDLLITPVSTTIFESIVLHRPIILTNYEKRKIPFSGVESAVICVSEPGKLKDQVALILDHSNAYWERVSPGREAVMKEFLSGMDGKSGDRLRRELQLLLRSGQETWKDQRAPVFTSYEK